MTKQQLAGEMVKSVIGAVVSGILGVYTTPNALLLPGGFRDYVDATVVGLIAGSAQLVAQVVIDIADATVDSIDRLGRWYRVKNTRSY